MVPTKGRNEGAQESTGVCEMKLISPETLARKVREQAAADLAQRQQAKTILTPAMLVSGTGKRASSAATRLMTTLGGVIRPITTDDLHKFRQAIAKLQSHEKRGGITVAEAIAQSRPEDLRRSRKEIPLAVQAVKTARTVTLFKCSLVDGRKRLVAP